MGRIGTVWNDEEFEVACNHAVEGTIINLSLFEIFLNDEIDVTIKELEELINRQIQFIRQRRYDIPITINPDQITQKMATPNSSFWTAEKELLKVIQVKTANRDAILRKMLLFKQAIEYYIETMKKNNELGGPWILRIKREENMVEILTQVMFKLQKGTYKNPEENLAA